MFINKSVVEENNLVRYTLANLFHVINVDGTSNKHGQIVDSVRGYLEIGSHKFKNHLLVTDLGNKAMIIRMTFLQQYNLEINWAAEEWKFTRCPETCDQGARKSRIIQEQVDELELRDTEFSWETPLDDLREENPINSHINWLETPEQSNEQEIAWLLATLTSKEAEGYFEDEEVNTTK